MMALLFVIALVVAVFVGTFLEYLMHRAMHEWGFFHRQHWRHHQENHADHWIWDMFTLYGPISIPFILMGLPMALWSWWLFLGWAAGGVLYVFVFSLCHFIQHSYPRSVFWMKTPIHHLHHRFDKGRNNYGVTVDWWDKVFGTYKKVDHARW